jgi:arylsulfatase A-like enzyme
MTGKTLSIALLALAAWPLTGACVEAERPNLVLIFIDDMGYGDIGPYGSTLNQTPNLDRMAAEGMRLTSFYAAPVCSASRAQLMTGCYAPRVSVPGVFFPASSKGLHPDEMTVAEYLQELGYATMCVGKWHLGDQPPFLPTRQGFDHYYGVPYSNDMQRDTLADGRRVIPLLRDEAVDELLEDENQRRLTRQYTEAAVQFIADNAQRPFFLYLPHTAMHVPLFPHQDFVGPSENGTYGDWVREVDWSVGQVLDALRQRRLDRNTLVLFTSDNGPWASRGAAGGVAGPLRGSKGCTLEGGVREPTIAWWPGQIDAGAACDAVAGTTDVLPTFVALAGGTPRPDVAIDGRNLAPLLLGQADVSPREAWYYYQGTQLKAVRSGPWKLAVAPQSLGMGIKERPADLQTSGRLYNLDEEIGEVTDVADQHPDVVARLQELAERMQADIGSGAPGPGVRPPGTVENPVTLYPTQTRDSGTRAKSQPIDWQKIKAGEAYASSAAPAVGGRPFAVRCTVESAGPGGIILAHGGTVVGYALYVKDGQLVFAVRHSAQQITRASTPLDTGKLLPIEARLESDGTLKLSVDGRDAAAVRSPGPLPSQPQEDLCLGHDNGHPLDDQAPRQPFDGQISGVEVVVSAERNEEIKGKD